MVEVGGGGVGGAANKLVVGQTSVYACPNLSEQKHSKCYYQYKL